MINDEIKNFKIQAERLSLLTFLLARVCEEKEQYFIKIYDLTNPEFRCMRFLNSENYSTVKQLANDMLITPGRVTQIISSLERKNLITREIDENDRRNIKIKLTELAKPYIKNVTEQHILLHEKVLEKIPFDNRETVLTAMQNLLDSLLIWSKQKD